MTERGFEYPCILDITKTCPLDCELHQLAGRQITRLAAESGNSSEEEVEILRSGTAEDLALFNSLNADLLKRAGLLGKCPNNVEGGSADNK